MDFFAHQDDARRRTFYLIGLYVLSLLCIIGSIYLAIVSGLVFSQSERTWLRMCAVTRQTAHCNPWWHPDIFFTVSGLVSIVVLVASFFKMWKLRSGGHKVAEALGGRLLNPQNAHNQERMLLNVVDEMAIASGTPVPPVYILDQEPSINAFCAGVSIATSVIAVTRGAVENLSRDELQGVIGHEFSHLLNGDARLNIRLIGILHGILALSIIGRTLIRSSFLNRERENGGAPMVFLGLILFSVGAIGVFFARLIKSAVSRQREYLADSSAVQFTRNPTGLAGALQKVIEQGSRVHHPRAEETSHLYFAYGLKTSWFSLLSTHPPLEKRIARLTEHRSSPSREPAKTTSHEREITTVSSHTTSARAVQEAIGTLQPSYLTTAASLLAKIPRPLHDAAHNAEQVSALFLSILVAENPNLQAVIKALLVDIDHYRMYERLLTEVKSAPHEAFIPLFEIAAPTLHLLTYDEAINLNHIVWECLSVDGYISLFEMCCCVIIDKYTDPQFATNTSQKFKPVSDIDEQKLILSALTTLSHTDLRQGRDAYFTATRSLGLNGELLPASTFTYANIRESFRRLTQKPLRKQQQFTAALLLAIQHDGIILPSEFDLFRTVCFVLDLPVPPLSQQQTQA
jgi:Zn-dependent protease with chaperone function